MKNSYKLLSSLLISVLSVTTLNAQTILIDAKDGTGMSRLNATYSNITISSNMSIATGAGACPMDGDIWCMDSSTKYIIIQNNNAKDIEKIELNGVLLVATSFGIVSCERKINSDGTGNLTPPIPLTDNFTTYSGTCDLHTFTNTVDNSGYPKYFKFTSPVIGGKNQPGIQSIAIYLKDTQTGMSATEQSSFNIAVSDGVLTFSESASQLSIYNISGQLVQRSENVQTIPLNTLPTGMYVVKATSVTGKNIITKIAR